LSAEPGCGAALVVLRTRLLVLAARHRWPLSPTTILEKIGRHSENGGSAAIGARERHGGGGRSHTAWSLQWYVQHSPAAPRNGIGDTKNTSIDKKTGNQNRHLNGKKMDATVGAIQPKSVALNSIRVPVNN